MEISLTHEQAKWLSNYLEEVITDWNWHPDTRPQSDEREHAQTIKRKIDKTLLDG